MEFFFCETCGDVVEPDDANFQGQGRYVHFVSDPALRDPHPLIRVSVADLWRKIKARLDDHERRIDQVID